MELTQSNFNICAALAGCCYFLVAMLLGTVGFYMGFTVPIGMCTYIGAPMGSNCFEFLPDQCSVACNSSVMLCEEVKCVPNNSPSFAIPAMVSGGVLGILGIIFAVLACVCCRPAEYAQLKSVNE